MREDVLKRQSPLPAGIHRASGAILSLGDCLRDPTAVVGLDELTEAQKIDLLRARWRAGEWLDIEYCGVGFIDCDRAISEIEAQSDIGRDFMVVGLRALEMALTAAGLTAARS